MNPAMRSYYERRAAEYDDWWLGTGQFAARSRPGWQAWQQRVLDDRSRHSVYKRWFTAAGLAEELGGGSILHDGPWFVAVRGSSRRS